MSGTRYPVLIVGAGAAGLAASTLLAWAAMVVEGGGNSARTRTLFANVKRTFDASFFQ